MFNNLSKDFKLRLKIVIAVIFFYAIAIAIMYNLGVHKQCGTIVNLQPVSGVAQPLLGAENK